MDIGQMTQLKKMYDILKVSSNPSAMINSMANSNPNLRAVLEDIKNSKTDPKEIFYEKAKAKGMTDEEINQFVKSLQNMLH